MADCVLGFQGSGKTLYAVHKIVETKSEYKAIYTNINDFKFSDNVHILDPNIFFNSIVLTLYGMFKADSNISDEVMKERLYELLELEYSSTHKILIVLDEAHNFIGKKSDLAQWFMTYHRHLNIEYLVITQLLSSINLDNRIFNNIYYALPSSRQFFPYYLRYKHYLGNNMADGNLRGGFSIRKKQEYFNMYHSGGKEKGKKSHLFIPLILLVFAVALLAWGFVSFNKKISNPGGVKEEENKVQNIKSHSLDVSSSKRASSRDVKTFYAESKIYSYFVDLSRSRFSCEDSRSFPTFFLPPPIYREKNGYGFYTYYYSKELEICVVEEKEDKKDILEKTEDSYS